MREPTEMGEEIIAFRAENERLREALRNCRTRICGWSASKDRDYEHVVHTLWNEIRRMDDIARATLAPPSPEEP